jgi:SPP1 family predicted phage head-tail adaptor
MRHRVRLEAPTGTRDAHGNPTNAFSLVAEVWASIEGLSGRELYQARQVEARATHTIRMRWVDGLSPTYRIVWNDPRGTPRTFHVHHVGNPGEVSHEHVLLVEEVVPT